MAIGEAAGTAAALAVRHETKLKDVDIQELRRTLEKGGAIVRI
jgi:hypothetical protein